MDIDVARLLDRFAAEVRSLPASAPGPLVERTLAALRTALTDAAGRPDHLLWSRLYRVAGRLCAAVDDGAALPGLRAFLDENSDLYDERAELIPA